MGNGDNQQGEFYVDSAHEIFYKKLDDSGNNLTEDMLVVNYTGKIQEGYYAGPRAYIGSIALDSDNNLHIIWEEERDHIFYYKKISSNGAFLTNDIIVLNCSYPLIPLQPNFALDSSDRIHLVWYELYITSPYTRTGKVFYKMLDNSGNPLTKDITVTTSASIKTSGRKLSSIAVDRESMIHIVWLDERDGNAEVYYKKGVIDGPLLKARFVDADREILVGLVVKLYSLNGSSVSIKTVDSAGWVNYTHLPFDTYRIKAFWKGFKVADESVEVSSRNPGILIDPLICEVYDLALQVIDEEGRVLPNQNVTLLLINGTEITTIPTNSTGHVIFENMPSTTFFIKVERHSDSRQIVLDRNKEVIIKLRMPILSVHCISNNQNLEGAIVKIYDANQKLIESKKTNSTGWADFKGLSPGDYKISVFLEGYNEKTVELELTSNDHTETITLEAIPLIETQLRMAIRICGIIAIALIVIIKRK